MTGDIRKLLGGYATNTLTEEERKVLFEASLLDQTLFEALADEHVLRELLDDPGARGALLRATEEPRFSARTVFLEWLQKPVAKGLVAAGLVLLIVIAVSALKEMPVEPVSQIADARLPERKVAPSLSLEMERPAMSAAPPQLSPAPKPKRAEPARPVSLTGTVQTKTPAQADVVAPPSVPSPVAPAEMNFEAALTRVAMKDGTRLEYTLLVRDREGLFHAISPDTLLDTGDALRMQLRANQAGFLTVAAGTDQHLFSDYIAPGTTMLIPATGFLAIGPSSSPTLKLAFTPMSAQLLRSFRPATESSFRQSQVRSKAEQAAPVPPAGGVIGGVPNGVSSGVLSRASGQQPAIAVEIPLKHK